MCIPITIPYNRILPHAPGIQTTVSQDHQGSARCLKTRGNWFAPNAAGGGNLAACQQLQRQAFLQAFLLTWRQACFTTTVDDPLNCKTEFDGILKQLDVDIANALYQFRSHGRQVTQALRHDDARFYGSLAQESSQWLTPQHARQFWQVLRRNLPRFRQRRIGYDPLKIEALEDQWMPHFASLKLERSPRPASC